MHRNDRGLVGRTRPPRFRWECRCGVPPVLLARYEPGGHIEIKVRDRFYYMASGCVQAICPRCGSSHILDLRPPDDGPTNERLTGTGMP